MDFGQIFFVLCGEEMHVQVAGLLWYGAGWLSGGGFFVRHRVAMGGEGPGAVDYRQGLCCCCFVEAVAAVVLSAGCWRSGAGYAVAGSACLEALATWA